MDLTERASNCCDAPVVCQACGQPCAARLGARISREELRARIAECDIDVRALARLVPCNHSTIYRVLTGSRNPSQALVRRLDEILGSCRDRAA